MHTLAPGSPRRLRSTALAIGAMFATNGLAFGSWVPRLPEVRGPRSASGTPPSA